MRGPSPSTQQGPYHYSKTQEPAREVAEQMPLIGPASLDCLNKTFGQQLTIRARALIPGVRNPEINDIRKIRIIPFSDYVLPDSAPPVRAIKASNIHFI